MIIEKYNALVGKINKFCDAFVAVSMLAMLVVLTIQIVSRFIAFMPIPWSQELLTFLLVASCFFGAGSATARGKQIRLEFFVMLLPKRLEKAFYVVADILSIVFLVIVVIQGFELTVENMGVIVGSSPIDYGYYYLVVVIGTVIMILNFIAMLIGNVQALFAKKIEEV